MAHWRGLRGDEMVSFRDPLMEQISFIHIIVMSD